MRKLFMFIAALTLSAGLWAETRTVSYDYPVYNTPDDPKSGIASWQTGEVEATVLENITETTWWGTGSDQGVSVLYSITRNLDKTLTFHVDAWGDVTGIATPQINIKDVYNNVDGDGNYTTTATYETDEVVNLSFYIPFTGAAARIDVAYTVGSKNFKPAIEVTGVSIAPASAAVEVGKTTSLTAIIKPAFATNTNISWSVTAGSENASVDANGVVTGLVAGAATVQVTTESGNKTATCDVNVVAQILLEPDAAPAAPTVPANQVKAIYSATYSADCGFGDWGGGTAYTQDTYGKKYVNDAGGYFGMVDFALNCSQMEKLHLDVWAVTDLAFRVVPIHGGTEQGVTVNIIGQQWNSIDIALNQGDWANVTDWSNVYQIKIDQAANETFWLNNVYFYTTQTKTTCALSASVKGGEGGTASVDNAEVNKGGTATFTAVADCGYSFVCWWSNTTKVSTEATYTPTDIQEDLTLVAEFAFVGPSEKITLTAADFTVTKDGDWTYDETEKRVKVEISEKYIMPESSNIDIYYNNDKTVKPIDPGTYQVYIDIEETDTYAAVTGITSEDWKFDIIDPKGAIQAIDDKKEEAMQAINSEAGDFETVPTVQKVVEDAKVDFEDVTITATNTINEATDQSTITTTKDDAISKIDKIEESAKTNIQTAIADFKESVKNEINNAAVAAKEEIDGLGVDESAKSEAKAEIDNIANTAEQTIIAATSKDAIDNAKTQAIADIHNVVQTTKDMWVIVREGMTINNYGTLCWNYNLTAIEGAELYTIAGIENDSIILKEVLAEETEAGAGYVILATAETLRVKNGLEYVQDPVPAESNNGLQGTFVDIVDGAAGTAGNILEGNYIVYNNEWRKCGVYTGLLSNRAYLVKDKVPNVIITQAPGRKYASMELPDETQTELNNVIADSDAITDIDKYFYKGQVIIRKGDKSFNIQGIEILPIE